MAPETLRWASDVDAFLLVREPALTEDATGILCAHTDSGALADMVALAIALPEEDRLRTALRFGDRCIYRREIANLAGRPDYPLRAKKA